MTLVQRTIVRVAVSLLLLVFLVVAFGPMLWANPMACMGVGSLIMVAMGLVIAIERPLTRAAPDLDDRAKAVWGYSPPRWVKLSARAAVVSLGLVLVARGILAQH